MKLLVAASFPEIQSGVCASTVATIREMLSEDVEVVSCEDIDWNTLRAVAPSFTAVYDSVVTEFDAIVILETSRRGVGCGVYAMAERMQDAGKTVAVFRRGEIQECRVEPWLSEDWKLRYGRCVTAEDVERGESESGLASDEEPSMVDADDYVS